eukprot:jgi/Botrbrau1/7900/Bobra.9_2s0073.1
MNSGRDATQIFTLEKTVELRVEANNDEEISFKLEEGSAEILGTEMVRGETITLKGPKLPIFTWEGAKIWVSSPSGKPLSQAGVIYMSDPDKFMPTYFGWHDELHAKRLKAIKEGRDGPRLLVVGPTNAGKSSLTRMLMNYACRERVSEDPESERMQPLFVDLDIGQGAIGLPGCIGASLVEDPTDFDGSLGGSALPLVYFFGSVSAQDNIDLYRHLVSCLASVLGQRSELSPKVVGSGMVINTMGFVEGAGFGLLLHVIECFKPTDIITLAQDRLYSQINNELLARGRSRNELVKMLRKLERNGGVVDRDRESRKLARDRRLREYFYGKNGELNPISTTVRAEKLQVFRIGATRAPSSALPLGAASVANPLKVNPVKVGADLLHALLAVSYAKTPDQIVSSNVAGFIHVTDVSMETGEITYLAPNPVPFPGRYLVAGNIRMEL